MPLDMIDENNAGKKCLVKYVLTKIRLSNLNSFIIELLDTDILNEGDDLIFIVIDKINNLELFYNLFDKFSNSNNVFIQLFLIDNLQINITKHVLVPKLKILDNEEKQMVKDTYNIDKIDDFPLILKSDSMAKFYGVKRGDLCEIIRTSETSGIYKSYRYCN